MASLGEQLRTGREAASLTIEEAAALTRIPREHLASLEADDLAALPGPPYTQGFIRIYAEVLRLQVEPLLDIYRAQESVPEPAFVATPTGTSSRTPGLTLLVLALAAAVVALIAVLIVSNSGDQPAGEGAEAGEGGESTDVARGALFELRVVSSTHVRIDVDGRTLVDETLAADEVRQWTPERETAVEVGASEAVTLTIDGEVVPQLAATGQPALHTWRVRVPTAAPVAPRPTGG